MPLARLVDSLSRALAVLSGWLFAITGAVIGYEVAARYLFNSPTIWAAEVAQLLLLWATFIAMAWPLREDKHIRIVLVVGRCGPRLQRLARVFSCLFVAAFATIAAWYGWDIAHDSLQRGRSTGTMLNIPNWWSEIVIPVGFGLLAVQALLEAMRRPLDHGVTTEGTPE